MLNIAQRICCSNLALHAIDGNTVVILLSDTLISERRLQTVLLARGNPSATLCWT